MGIEYGGRERFVDKHSQRERERERERVSVWVGEGRCVRVREIDRERYI